MPQVLHGPRVEPGGTGVAAVHVGRNLDTDDQPVYFPSFYAGGRWGYVPERGGWGLSAGAQVAPIAIAFALDEEATSDALDELVVGTSYLDAYLQPPGLRGTAWDAGVGALASTALLAPYLQLGHTGADGDGWYTTQAVAFTRDPLFEDGRFWLPSLMWRDTGREGSGGAIHVGLSGGFGRIRDASVWWLGVSVIMELGLPH